MVELTPEQAARSLRELWRAGRRSLRRLRMEEIHHGDKEKALLEEGAQEGLNYDTLAKARRFAQEYTREAVDDLCRQVRRYQAPFGGAHMVRLLSVPVTHRKAFFHEALKAKWSGSRLDVAIRERFGRRRQGGRRPRVPDDPPARLSFLDGLCTKWLRWCAAAGPQLPAGLREQVSKASRAVRRVHDTVTAELERLRRSRQRHSR